jgi:hypothetical protein
VGVALPVGPLEVEDHPLAGRKMVERDDRPGTNVVFPKNPHIFITVIILEFYLIPSGNLFGPGARYEIIYPYLIWAKTVS